MNALIHDDRKAQLEINKLLIKKRKKNNNYIPQTQRNEILQYNQEIDFEYNNNSNEPKKNWINARKGFRQIKQFVNNNYGKLNFKQIVNKDAGNNQSYKNIQESERLKKLFINRNCSVDDKHIRNHKRSCDNLGNKLASKSLVNNVVENRMNFRDKHSNSRKKCLNAFAKYETTEFAVEKNNNLNQTQESSTEKRPHLKMNNTKSSFKEYLKNYHHTLKKDIICHTSEFEQSWDPNKYKPLIHSKKSESKGNVNFTIKNEKNNVNLIDNNEKRSNVNFPVSKKNVYDKLGKPMDNNLMSIKSVQPKTVGNTPLNTKNVNIEVAKFPIESSKFTPKKDFSNSGKNFSGKTSPRSPNNNSFINFNLESILKKSELEYNETRKRFDCGLNNEQHLTKDINKKKNSIEKCNFGLIIESAQQSPRSPNIPDLFKINSNVENKELCIFHNAKNYPQSLKESKINTNFDKNDKNNSTYALDDPNLKFNFKLSNSTFGLQ